MPASLQFPVLPGEPLCHCDTICHQDLTSGHMDGATLPWTLSLQDCEQNEFLAL